MSIPEDASYIRPGHAARNMSVLLCLTLNQLRQASTATGDITAKYD